MKDIDETSTGDVIAKLSEALRGIEENFKKSLNPFQKNAVSELEKINKSLRDETERGCVVIGAAFLDEKLEELLSKVTAGSNKQKKSLFDATGPLGTFSGKTRIAYCFGLISDEAHHDLNVIRAIRNDFAHLSTSISLRDREMASKCASLQLPGFMGFSSFPRLAFTSSIGAIAGEINEVIETLEPFTPRTSTFRSLVKEIEAKKKIGKVQRRPK